MSLVVRNNVSERAVQHDPILQFHVKRREAYQSIISVLENHKLFDIQLEIEQLWIQFEMSPVHFLRQCYLILLQHRDTIDPSALKREMNMDEHSSQLELIYGTIDHPIIQGQIMLGMEEAKHNMEQMKVEEQYKKQLETHKKQQSEEDQEWQIRIRQRRRRAYCDLFRRKTSSLLGCCAIIVAFGVFLYVIGFGNMIMPFLTIAKAGDGGLKSSNDMAKMVHDTCQTTYFSFSCMGSVIKATVLGVPTTVVSSVASWLGWTPIVCISLFLVYMVVHVFITPIVEICTKGWSLEFDSVEPVRTVLAPPQQVRLVKQTSTVMQLLELEEKRKQTLLLQQK